MANVVQLHGSLLAPSSPSLQNLAARQQTRTSSGARTGSGFVVRAEVTDASKVALNPDIKKDSPKVVDTVSVADLSGATTAYCRCWRSGTFPLCDGTHAKYNKSSGDNVGPLLLKK